MEAWAFGQESNLQIISHCKERKLVVKVPFEKTMLGVLRGGNSTWNWQPFFCHHLVIFLFSSEGSPGSAGSDRCSIEQSPSASYPTSPALHKGWVKGADVEPDYFDRGWVPPSPFLPKNLFSLLMFGWIIPILNEKQRGTERNYSKRVGETSGRKVQRKPQRFSALEMVSEWIHPNLLICWVLWLREEKKREMLFFKALCYLSLIENSFQREFWSSGWEK